MSRSWSFCRQKGPLGVQNAEAIYSLPGCDAVFVGPNDLRFQMRAADGTFPTDEEHEAMIQRVIQIGRNVGKPTGIHVQSTADAQRRVDQGMQFHRRFKRLRYVVGSSAFPS